MRRLDEAPHGVVQAALALTAALGRSGDDGCFRLAYASLLDRFHGSTRTPVAGEAGETHLRRRLGDDDALALVRTAAADPTLVDDGRAAPWVWSEGSVVPRRFWRAEATVGEEIARLHAAGETLPAAPFDAALAARPQLGHEQQQALRAARGPGLRLVVGGPGTGKTTLSHRIVGAWLAAGLEPGRVARAAPTGKAARRMGDGGPPDPELPEPRTIHRLLAGGSQSLQAVLVDEASMIGLELMARLTAGLPTGVRLVLVGDPDQLPSVEAGAPFRDLAARFPERTRRLTEQHRAVGPLVSAAEAVRRGDAAALRAGGTTTETAAPTEEGLFLHPPLDDARRAPWMMRWLAATRDHSAVLLTVTKEGRWGTRALNRVASQLRDPERTGRTPGQPMMATRNDYARHLFNGEVGRLTADGRVDFGDGRCFARGSLRGLEPADALTVHKAQGSEFDTVAFVLPPPGHGLGTREMLYTALTRARRRVILIGSPDALDAMLDAPTERTTGLTL
jgi:exodeoxyribonuclease V alpha subunit